MKIDRELAEQIRSLVRGDSRSFPMGELEQYNIWQLLLCLKKATLAMEMIELRFQQLEARVAQLEQQAAASEKT